MPTNFFFQNGGGIGNTAEGRLIEDLIIESLKIYGHDVFYLPRTLVKKDFRLRNRFASHSKMCKASKDKAIFLQDLVWKLGIKLLSY